MNAITLHIPSLSSIKLLKANLSILAVILVVIYFAMNPMQFAKVTTIAESTLNSVRIMAISTLQTEEEKAMIEFNAKQVVVLKAKVVELQTKLDNALIPEDNLKDAFNNHAIKPVVNVVKSSAVFVDEHFYTPAKNYVVSFLQ